MIPRHSRHLIAVAIVTGICCVSCKPTTSSTAASVPITGTSGLAKASGDMLMSLRTGDYSQFRRLLASGTPSDHKISEATLERVFREFLVPIYKKPSYRLRQIGESHETGTAGYFAKLPNTGVEVVVGSTARFKDGLPGNALEDIFASAFAILSAEKNDIPGPLQHMRNRASEVAPTLSKLGMNGIARTQSSPKYYLWKDYIALYDRAIATERHQGNPKP